jgi:hypothetical protein
VPFLYKKEVFYIQSMQKPSYISVYFQLLTAGWGRGDNIPLYAAEKKIGLAVFQVLSIKTEPKKSQSAN